MEALSKEILVAGGGLIGLSIALELAARGRRVTILEQGKALQQSATAAAGMLAADDPFHPPALRPLASWSASLWPGFLQRLNDVSGRNIQFQTTATRQYLSDGTQRTFAELSVDPREVASALLCAVQKAGIELREDTAWTADTPRPAHVVHATGAWFAHRPGVRPCKGQMLRVRLREPLLEVHRSEDVYVVPRHSGPQAGTALLGATLEDAGFDVTTHAEDLSALRERAALLVPQVADAAATPEVEAWAGLRPMTRDGLPLLGFLPGGTDFVATGHFRNGVLLAPASAVLVADALEGRAPLLGLSAFAPDRFP